MRRESRDKMTIAMHPQKGRVILARADIAAGELLEAAPIVVLEAADCAALDATTLGHYYFHWDGDADGDGRGAIGLGYVTLCNHSARPRARIVRNHAGGTLDLVAAGPIAAGEEVTIDYNCALWFKVSE